MVQAVPRSGSDQSSAGGWVPVSVNNEVVILRARGMRMARFWVTLQALGLREKTADS